MAWTASLKSKSLVKGVIKLAIEYTNGTTTFEEALDISQPADAKAALKRIQTRLQHLDRLDTMFQNIVLGPIDFSPLDPVPPPPDTPAEVWELSFTKLRVALHGPQADFYTAGTQ